MHLINNENLTWKFEIALAVTLTLSNYLIWPETEARVNSPLTWFELLRQFLAIFEYWIRFAWDDLQM